MNIGWASQTILEFASKLLNNLYYYVIPEQVCQFALVLISVFQS